MSQDGGLYTVSSVIGVLNHHCFVCISVCELKARQRNRPPCHRHITLLTQSHGIITSN